MATTVEYTIGAGADDTGYYANAFSTTGVVNWIGHYSTRYQHASYRWTGVTIPVGATITTAYIILRVTSKDGTGGAVTIYFDDTATPTAPTTAAELTGKTQTTQNVAWSLGTTNGNINSPDIKAIIQELVNSYNYSAGAAMQALLINSVTGNNDTATQTYESNPSYLVPTLHIEYTEAATGNPQYAYAQQQ
jgi:hypothetical protein